MWKCILYFSIIHFPNENIPIYTLLLRKQRLWWKFILSQFDNKTAFLERSHRTEFPLISFTFPFSISFLPNERDSSRRKSRYPCRSLIILPLYPHSALSRGKTFHELFEFSVKKTFRISIKKSKLLFLIWLILFTNFPSHILSLLVYFNWDMLYTQIYTISTLTEKIFHIPFSSGFVFSSVQSNEIREW